MPSLSFSRLIEQLLDGSKTQTIRRPRKRQWELGDKLFIFWNLRRKNCRRLGVAVLVKLERKKFDEISDEDFKKDGFESIWAGRKAFMKMYPYLEDHRTWSTEFDILTFEWIEGPIMETKQILDGPLGPLPM